MSQTCKSCRQEIDFVRTRAKAWMPVESAEPEEYRIWTDLPVGVYLHENGRATTKVRLVDHVPTDHAGVQYRKLVLITEDGDVLNTWQGWTPDQKAPTGWRALDGPCRITGYEQHWGRCPGAAQLRKERP